MRECLRLKRSYHPMKTTKHEVDLDKARRYFLVSRIIREMFAI